MKIFNNLKKYLLIKRPIVSIISNKPCDFIIIKQALSTCKNLGLKNFTFKYKEADILIINGFYTPTELNQISNIINCLKPNCRIINYGFTNIQNIKTNLIKKNCNQDINSLIKLISTIF